MEQNDSFSKEKSQTQKETTVEPSHVQEPEIIHDNNNDSLKEETTSQIINDDTEKLKEENKKKLLEEELKRGYEKAVNLKKEGNDKFKAGNYVEAEKYYNEGSNCIEEILVSVEEFNHPIFAKLKEERVNILSNLSNCLMKHEKFQESFNIDMTIISQLDANWDKSYNRIILCALKNNDSQLAIQYAGLFKMRFSESTLSKYQSTFKDVEDAQKKLYESTKPKAGPKEDTTIKSSINESDVQSEVSKPVKVKTVKKPASRFRYTWIFGSVVLLGSAFGLFMLFKNRNKFLN